MENSRDNQEKIEQENKLPNGVAEAISIQSGKRVENVEEEMAEAIQKMNKLIEDRIFVLQHENEGLVIDSKQASETKSIAKFALINAMLNQTSLDEIDVILNSAVVEAIKHVDPREQELDDAVSVPKRKEEVIMDYIANSAQKSNAERYNNASENKKDLSIDISPAWKGIIGSNNFEDAMKNMDEKVRGVVQSVEQALGIPISEIQDERTAILIRFTMSTLSGIVLDENGKVPEEAQNQVKSSMYYLAGIEDEYTDKALKVVSEMFGYNITGENGEIDRNKILELCDRMIYGDEIYESMPEEAKTSLEKAKFDTESLINRNLKRQKEKDQDVKNTEEVVASDTKSEIFSRLLINKDDIDISNIALEAIRGDFDSAVNFFAQFDKNSVDNFAKGMRDNYDTIRKALEEVAKQKGYNLQELDNVLKQKKESQDENRAPNKKSNEVDKKSDEEKRSEFYSLILNGNSSTLRRDMTNAIENDIRIAVEIQKQLINHSLGNIQQINYDTFASIIEEKKQEMFKEAFQEGRQSSSDFEETITTLAEIDLDFVGKSMENLLQENKQGTFDQDKIMTASGIIKSIADRKKSSQEKNKIQEENDASNHVLSANNEAINNLAKGTNAFKSSSKDDKSIDDDAR